MLSMRECAQSNMVQQKSLLDQQRMYTVDASRTRLKGFTQPTGMAAPCSQAALTIHHKKKVREFPVPSRDVTTKLSLGGNNDVITELFLPRGSLVSDIPAGDRKLVNLFLRCRAGTVKHLQLPPPPIFNSALV
jgi:hypothetical protein